MLYILVSLSITVGLASGFYAVWGIIWSIKIRKYTRILDEINQNIRAINNSDETLFSKKGKDFFKQKEDELFAEGKKLMSEFDELKQRFPWRWL